MMPSGVKSWPGCKSPDTGSGQRRQIRSAEVQGRATPLRKRGVGGDASDAGSKGGNLWRVSNRRTVGLGWVEGQATPLVGVQRRTVYGRFFKDLRP